MVSKDTKIINPEGFHMRPANFFVKEMSSFKSTVHFIINGKPVDAKSIMSIMASCIKCGTELTVECEGEDEKAALDRAVELIEAGLGD